jgi:hypothetical protein
MSNADWYARKLRGEPAPVRREPLAPIPVAMPVPVQAEQFRPTMPQPAAAPTRWQDGCPQCGSNNYGKPVPSMEARCFDCGYGLPIQNSTQGMPAPNTGVATPAVQVASAGYNPGQIIGRVE